MPSRLWTKRGLLRQSANAQKDIQKPVAFLTTARKGKWIQETKDHRKIYHHMRWNIQSNEATTLPRPPEPSLPTSNGGPCSEKRQLTNSFLLPIVLQLQHMLYSTAGWACHAVRPSAVWAARRSSDTCVCVCVCTHMRRSRSIVLRLPLPLPPAPVLHIYFFTSGFTAGCAHWKRRSRVRIRTWTDEHEHGRWKKLLY